MRQFWSITLPLLRPTIAFVLVTSVIGSFQIFDTIAVTTMGGPANATQTIVWYVYQNAFASSRMGYASAMSVVLFLFLIVISLVPQILISGIHLNNLWLVGGFFERLPTWVTHGLNVSFYFGGTSLLIVVGVAMDTVNQVESQLIMRHYDGFSPRSGRVRGRRSW